MTQPAAGDAVKVELAYPMTINGVDYEPDSVVELPYLEDRENGGPVAKDLVRTGRARWHVPSPDEIPPPPPRSGAGSGRDAWVAYATDREVPVTDDMTRDDIADAVEAAGTTTSTEG